MPEAQVLTRTVLVTGAASGIGLAVAADLAMDGYRVIGTWHVNPPPHGMAQIEWLQVNLTDESSIQSLYETLDADGTAVDILISNAGAVRDRALIRSSISDSRWMIDVNLGSHIYLTSHFGREMVARRWGRIIYISSSGAQVGNPGQAAYSSAKLGLIGLARSAAREFGSRGVTVNLVAPGIIQTDQMGSLPQVWVNRWLDRVPSSRAGTPSEVVEGIRFLIDENASGVTGLTLPVDGGISTRFRMQPSRTPRD